MLSELLSDLRYRLRALFSRDALERELDDEVRFHLEREVDKHVAMGMSRDAARRQAQLAFGGVDRAKEASRDARGVVFIEAMLQPLSAPTSSQNFAADILALSRIFFRTYCS